MKDKASGLSSHNRERRKEGRVGKREEGRKERRKEGRPWREAKGGISEPPDHSRRKPSLVLWGPEGQGRHWGSY